MANRQAQDGAERGKSTADYYKLNTRAIEDLASADKSNSPEVSAKELKQYGAKQHLKLSQWLKAILIKAWFNGVVCYFFLWGLGGYIADSLDLWLITAVALGWLHYISRPLPSSGGTVTHGITKCLRTTS